MIIDDKFEKIGENGLLGGFMEELLQNKGFSLNTYPEGKFCEWVVEDNEELKVKICIIFNAVVKGSDIETSILQCAEDFTKCIYYYDCNPFDMETDNFMKYVEKI